MNLQFCQSAFFKHLCNSSPSRCQRREKRGEPVVISGFGFGGAAKARGIGGRTSSRRRECRWFLRAANAQPAIPPAQSNARLKARKDIHFFLCVRRNSWGCVSANSGLSGSARPFIWLCPSAPLNRPHRQSGHLYLNVCVCVKVCVSFSQ